MDQRIERGRKRLLTADDALYADRSQAMADARREREALAAERTSAERTASVDIESETDEALNRLWTLPDDLDATDPDRLTEVLRRLVQRIELHFGRIEKPKRTECPLQTGRVLLHPHLYGNVKSGRLAIDIS